MYAVGAYKRVFDVVVINQRMLFVCRGKVDNDKGWRARGDRMGYRWCGSDYQGRSALCLEGLFVERERRWCLLGYLGMYCCVVRSGTREVERVISLGVVC